MFTLVEIDELDLSGGPGDYPPARHALRCECGRFARWGGDRHYYNGWYDCYSYTISCAKCGDVTIECV